MQDGDIGALNRLWDSVGGRLLPPEEEEAVLEKTALPEEKAKLPAETPPPAPTRSGVDYLGAEALLRSCYRQLVRMAPGSGLRREVRVLLASQEEWYARLAAAAFLRRGYAAQTPGGCLPSFAEGLRQCFLQEEGLLLLYEEGGVPMPDALVSLAAERKRSHLESIAAMAQTLFAGM